MAAQYLHSICGQDMPPELSEWYAPGRTGVDQQSSAADDTALGIISSVARRAVCDAASGSTPRITPDASMVGL